MVRNHPIHTREKRESCYSKMSPTMEAKAAANNVAPKKKRTKGGIKTIPFIFGNEIAANLALIGFSANMMSYLTQQLHMPLVKAATTLNNFGATACFTPMVGAFLADAYLGRFLTISASSLVYLMGMISLTMSAFLPGLRPSPCIGDQHCEEASRKHAAFLYVSLALTAVGAGGIRPCVAAFGAEQFEGNDRAEKKATTKTWNFFNWYYFCMGVPILLAVTVVVYVQDNVGWGWGLGIPTIAMAISVVCFVGGYPMYLRVKPAGSPFTRLAQVVVAAVRKRKVAADSGPGALYKNDELDASISVFGELVHTDHLKFFDKAAVVTEEDRARAAGPTTRKPNLWELNTVHRVEELKSVLRMAPIWAAGILNITASAQQGTFSLQQARTMDRHFSRRSSFQIPPGSMPVFTMLATLTTIVLYDRCLIPVTRRYTGLGRGISYLRRMGIGFAVNVLATLVAGLVEVRRREAAAAHGLTDSPAATIPMSAFWLVPQYAMHGVSEGFSSVGHMEYFYDQSPESMRSTATALWWLSLSVGGYVSTLIITLIHRYSAGPGGSNWLPDNLNKGRLEFLYWIITFLQLLNLLYYMVCAWFYTYKPVQVRPRDEDGNVDASAREMQKV